jgi:hypothetical protein
LRYREKSAFSRHTGRVPACPESKPRWSETMLDTLTLDNFVPYLNDTFWIRLEDGRVETRLVEATKMGSGSYAGRSPFSLVFAGPGRFALPQQTYLVEHEALGEMEIFLVCLGPDGAGMRYQAIFT